MDSSIPTAFSPLFGKPFNPKVVDALETLGLSELERVRIQEMVLLFKQSETGRKEANLGFHPETYIPCTGPEHERHWRQIIQSIFASTAGPSLHKADLHLRGLTSLHGFEPHMPLLDFESVNETLNVLSSLGLVILPKSLQLRRLLAHLVSNYFDSPNLNTSLAFSRNPFNTNGREHRDKTLTAIVTWISKPDRSKPLVLTLAQEKSFDLFNEIVAEFGENIVVNEHGITLTGQSGLTYQIEPKTSSPFFRVTDKISRTRVCLVPRLTREGYPLGDTLSTLILALRNDVETAKHIEVLAHFIAWSKNVPHCQDCGCVIRNRLHVHPNRCANCVVRLHENNPAEYVENYAIYRRIQRLARGLFEEEE